jgi:ribosomal protein S18 acetylase RimI-like enzyme
MAESLNMKIESTNSPAIEDITVLTDNINQESKDQGIEQEASAFGFFIRNNDSKLIAGVNGSIIYGSIYTDQLWVDTSLRHQGIGRMLMEKVHELGSKKGCKMATACTMSFQAQEFYEKLGYECDFERKGYANGSSCLFLKKRLLR